MNIVIKKQILEQINKMIDEPEIEKALTRIICSIILNRIQDDPLYAHKIKEALK
jgi:hypothetical protein